MVEALILIKLPVAPVIVVPLITPVTRIPELNVPDPFTSKSPETS